MKVGDIVMHKKKGCTDHVVEVDHRREWGVGYVIEVHRTMYENHVPFVTVFWPKWNTKTKDSQTYLEAISASR